MTKLKFTVTEQKEFSGDFDIEVPFEISDNPTNEDYQKIYEYLEEISENPPEIFEEDHFRCGMRSISFLVVDGIPKPIRY